jgi:hypothetical protein
MMACQLAKTRSLFYADRREKRSWVNLFPSSSRLSPPSDGTLRLHVGLTNDRAGCTFLYARYHYDPNRMTRNEGKSRGV